MKPEFDDVSENDVYQSLHAAGVTKAQIGHVLRHHVHQQLCDNSGAEARGIAIYTLSDPRSIRDVRYVGQTQSPSRRLRQHVNTARLWLTGDVPWWVKCPTLRPLYSWIRELYADERRLPVMVITAWADSIAQARVLERTQIVDCLQNRFHLLNVEREILGRQCQLI